MVIDNHEIIASFIDETDDKDTFWYTELLDRTIKGSSRFKLLRSFEHSCRAHFLEQMPTIRKLCDQTGTRAYTRLSPRSRRAIGKALAKHTVSLVLDGHYEEIRRAYASMCGKTAIHGRKLWLFDIDHDINGDAPLESPIVVAHLIKRDVLIVPPIPSKNGCHWIVKPHHIDYHLYGIQVHKDNPTNLYIPDNSL